MVSDFTFGPIYQAKTSVDEIIILEFTDSPVHVR